MGKEVWELHPGGKEVKCEECESREAVINFSMEPMLTITHGFGGKQICRKCFIKKIKDHIKDCQEQLNEQEIILEGEYVQEN